MSARTIALGDLAQQLGVRLEGAGDVLIDRIAPLDKATTGSLSFLGDVKMRAWLDRTGASAVILRAVDAAACPVPCLIDDNPYLSFARAAWILHPPTRVAGGRHPSAVVSGTACVDASAWIGPTAVVEDDVVVGARAFIGPGCVIGRASRIGAGSRLVARVTICEGTQIGDRALIHPGAVIGREGFGFAKDGRRWVRMPQIGRVILGNDVEIGANTTVDRGAIEDTIIEDGVKLDNLIQIGHNCHIGENTAMAACSGISGSTRIGADCTIAGAVGVAGHLEIADNVHFTGMAMVTRSVSEPGLYSSGIPAMPSADWRRGVVRFRQLDDIARRLKRLEERLPEEDRTPADSDDPSV